MVRMEMEMEMESRLPLQLRVHVRAHAYSLKVYKVQNRHYTYILRLAVVFVLYVSDMEGRRKVRMDGVGNN